MKYIRFLGLIFAFLLADNHANAFNDEIRMPLGAMMKIPFTTHEIKWHTPGAPAEHSASRQETGKALPGKIANGILDALPVKVRSTGDAAVSERLRGKFTYLADKAAALSGANTPVGRQRLQAAAGDATWAQKNEKYAHEALHDVRLALYSKEHGSFKSTNKFSTGRRESEIDRLSKGKFADMYDPSAVNSRHDWALRSKNIWESTKINCDGLAIAVADYMAHRHPQAPVSIGMLPGHTFAVIGAIEPENVNLPLGAWPSHIHVCDPWANIACPASEYPARFEQKMKKWHENGKMIQTSEGKWISPLDPKWVSCIKETPTLYTRRQFTDGQFDGFRPSAPPVELAAASLTPANIESSQPSRELNEP